LKHDQRTWWLSVKEEIKIKIIKIQRKIIQKKKNISDLYEQIRYLAKERDRLYEKLGIGRNNK
tara:strand:- start:304 stop:492 length:189 start_codon:yes stop_codon:yes gene_type:complete